MAESTTVNVRVIDMPEVQAALEALSDEITRLQRELTDKTVALAAKEIELIGSESVTLRNGWRDEVTRLRAALKQIADADQGVGRGRYDLIEIAVKALNPERADA